MKIAFIGQKGIPAKSEGVEKNVEEMALRIAQAGHDVFVYVSTGYVPKELKHYKGVRLIHIPGVYARYAGDFVHALLSSVHSVFAKYDVIHYQARNTSFLSLIPKIFRPGAVIVSTFDLQCDFHGRSSISVRYSMKTDAISKWKLRDKKYVLFSEKLIKQTGVHYLIEAFKQLEDTAKTPNNFKLVIVGDDNGKDDYVKYLHTISEGRDNIIFVGAQKGEAARQLFSHAYMFVQPSESETASATLLEAMGYGLAPLVSDTKENLDVIGEGGFVFESRSVQSLRDKLAYLLNRSDEIERMSQRAEKRIQQEYSWESNAAKTVEVYNKYMTK